VHEIEVSEFAPQPQSMQPHPDLNNGDASECQPRRQAVLDPVAACERRFRRLRHQRELLEPAERATSSKNASVGPKSALNNGEREFEQQLVAPRREFEL
jgi:hypothetical protein